MTRSKTQATDPCSLTLIKVEVQLLRNRAVLLLDLDAYLTDVTLRPVVQPTVVEDQVHVSHKVLNLLVLVSLQLVLDRLEIHWVFDNGRVVWNLQLHIVDWVSKNQRLLVSMQRGK